jgi:GNAT superfamily N-acetyltransferase
MDLQIKEVVTKKDFKDFVNFPYRLYQGNPYNVPKLRFDEMATLSKTKNPAFDYCEARFWLALKNEKVVGRIAAIINHSYIKKWKNNYMRFGWIDFEEDKNIAAALLSQVENWAKEKGMTAVHGPMGFTDLDFEGMLMEGYDQLGTLATIYNYPYYPVFLNELGYKKEVDWLEYKILVPSTIPERIERTSAVIMERLGLQVVKAKKPKEILPYAPAIFKLINEAYAHLHGVVELTEKQIKYYTKQYFSFIRTDFVTLVKDKEGNLAAFGITMPSLSVALQKANGSLFPFGFVHILKALKKNSIGDMYLVAVRHDLQGKGVTAVLINEIAKSYIRNGIQYAESNPELETNQQVQSFWKYFDAKNHKRRRCFIKNLNE